MRSRSSAARSFVTSLPQRASLTGTLAGAFLMLMACGSSVGNEPLHGPPTPPKSDAPPSPPTPDPAATPSPRGGETQALHGTSSGPGKPFDPKTLPTSSTSTSESTSEPKKAIHYHRGPMCEKHECGPAPGMPNQQCPDGKTVAGPFCDRNTDGSCSWKIISCPK
jgi:hypothetical protein